MNKLSNNTQIKFNAAKIMLLAGIMAVSSSVFADDDDNHKRHKNSKHKPYVYGKVVDVTPVYRQIRVSHPVKECWSEPVSYKRSSHSYSNSVGNTLAGGLIGGVIGHQFGKGRGRDLATAAGAIIGAQVGHDSSRSGYYDKPSYDRYASHYKDVCETKNRVSYEEVVDSYNVKYRYKGQRYQANMPYDPGKKIKLKITVGPVF